MVVIQVTIIRGFLDYADDLAILSPSLQGLKHMVKICEQFAIEYHIRFNPKKSKLSCYNVKCSHDIIVKIFDETIEIVDGFSHLGNFVYNKLWKKNTTNIVQNMYCSSNSILNYFSILYSTDIKKLHNTFCMNAYSSELLELSNKYMELINIA